MALASLLLLLPKELFDLAAETVHALFAVAVRFGLSSHTRRIGASLCPALKHVSAMASNLLCFAQTWGAFMARYIIKASNEAGPVEFNERLTIEAALAKAQELSDAHFTHITVINVLTGLEITDLEELMPEHGDGEA